MHNNIVLSGFKNKYALYGMVVFAVVLMIALAFDGKGIKTPTTQTPKSTPTESLLTPPYAPHLNR